MSYISPVHLATDEDLMQDFGSRRLLMHLSETAQTQGQQYEEENQALLQSLGAEQVWVVRDSEGKIEELSARFPNGEEDVLFHNSSDRPTQMTTSTLTPETPRPGTESTSPVGNE